MFVSRPENYIIYCLSRDCCLILENLANDFLSLALEKFSSGMTLCCFVVDTLFSESNAGLFLVRLGELDSLENAET